MQWLWLWLQACCGGGEGGKGEGEERVRGVGRGVKGEGWAAWRKVRWMGWEGGDGCIGGGTDDERSVRRDERKARSAGSEGRRLAHACDAREDGIPVACGRG